MVSPLTSWANLWSPTRVRLRSDSLHPLHLHSNIIHSHDIDHHSYADDTQLQDKDKPDNVHSLLTRTADCFDDVKNWMTANKLKLNDDKTKAMLVGTH